MFSPDNVIDDLWSEARSGLSAISLGGLSLGSA